MYYLYNAIKNTFLCALVDTIVEYGSVVWDPHTADNVRQIEVPELY